MDTHCSISSIYTDGSIGTNRTIGGRSDATEEGRDHVDPSDDRHAGPAVSPEVPEDVRRVPRGPLRSVREIRGGIGQTWASEGVSSSTGYFHHANSISVR